MATTTPNFGWSVPTSTDLVKDGATAIETLGDAIDASLVDLKGGTTGQVLSKNSNTDMDFTWVSDATGMTNPMTTTGDTIYSSSGSTPARLGIGSTGQVLTVAGGVPSWATPSSGSLTLLSTTSMTGGVNTVTVSSISQNYTHLEILIEDFTMAVNDKNLQVRFNGDTGSNYFATFDNNNTNSFQTGGILYTSYPSADGNNALYMQIPFYTNPSVSKILFASYNGESTTGSGYKRIINEYMVGWKSSSAITSFTLFNATDSTNFATGSIKIYGVN